MRVLLKWEDAGGVKHEASFPDRGSARGFSGGLTDLGLLWAAYEVRPIDFEDGDATLPAAFGDGGVESGRQAPERGI